VKVLLIIFSLILTFHSQVSVTYGQDFTSIGVSSFVYEAPYSNKDVENTWSPFIALQYKKLFIRDVELGYPFLTTYDYRAAISLSGDELSKQRKGEGNTVNDGLNLKGSFSLYSQSGIYILTAMQDVSGVYDGKESTLSWLYTLRGSSLTWYPHVYAS
jgi:outer membrane scaffolding protein for murein synthesis (MipA/OmpV family)